MSIEKVGVQLVAEGESAYTSALDRAAKSIEKLAAACEKGEQRVKGTSTALDKAAKSTESMATAAKKGEQETNGASESMVGMITTGNILSTVITGAATAVLSLVSSAGQLIISGVNMTASLQDMRLNIETLVAAEIKGADKTMTMADALDKAAPVADDLMRKLKDLSLQSPFEYQEILAVFQMNKAFGQSLEMSMKLTGAITNLAAANRTIPGIMQRISYNFSQMAMTGTITSRDLRDLALTGLDLSKVLREQLGMSIDEVNAKLKTGEMTFEQVSEAFVTYVGENFSTAAERASRTFNGLKSSFNDLAFFSSVDIFGQALETVTGNLQTLFDKIRGFIEAGGLKPIGDGLDWAAGKFFEFSNAAVASGEQFINEYGAEMQAGADQAFSWGINISVQLAEGIINGASAALTMAMDYVSQMLSWFLAPGSPPRVAPDIDLWGTAAMGQFLRGMTDADFGVLNSIGGSLRSTIGSLVSGGLLSSEAGGELSATLQEGLIQALSGNGDFSAVIAQISSSLGPYSDEVALLADREKALQTATDEAVAAQERLKNAQTELRTANSDMIENMDEYNALAKSGASPEVLKAKRAEWQAAKDRQKLAQKEVITSAKLVNETSDRVGAAKTEVDSIQQIIAALLELARAREQAQGSGAGGGADALGARGGAGGGSGEGRAGLALPAFPELKKTGADMEALTGKIKAQLSSSIFQPFTDMMDRLTGPNGSITKLETSWATFSQSFSDYYNTVLKGPLGDLVVAFDAFVATGALEWLATGLGVIIAIPTVQFFTGFFTVLTLVSSGLATMSGMGDSAAVILVKLIDWAGVAFDKFTDFAVMLAGPLLDGWRIVATFMVDNVNPIFIAIGTYLSGAFSDAIADVAGFIGGLRDTFDSITNGVLGGFSAGLDGISTSIDNLIGWIGDLAAKFMTLTVPEWLIPGSPTPFEMGLRGIANAARGLSSAELPKMADALGMGANAQDAQYNAMQAMTPQPVIQSTNTTNYDLTLQSNMRPASVQMGFEAMRIMAARS